MLAQLEQPPVETRKNNDSLTVVELLTDQTYKDWPHLEYTIRKGGVYAVRHTLLTEFGNHEGNWSRVSVKRDGLRPFTLDVLPGNAETLGPGLVFVYDGMRGALSQRVNILEDDSLLRAYKVPEHLTVEQESVFWATYGQ
jgi:hypothetical protein